MNDTQPSPEFDQTVEGNTEAARRVAELAALDPAQAPEFAERYAADLEADLEESEAVSQQPRQMQVDLGTDA